VAENRRRGKMASLRTAYKTAKRACKDNPTQANWDLREYMERAYTASVMWFKLRTEAEDTRGK
jgi:hypothetical protein